MRVKVLILAAATSLVAVPSSSWVAQRFWATPPTRPESAEYAGSSSGSA
jgi:hypothetical protein